jgi:hypothetical protein
MRTRPGDPDGRNINTALAYARPAEQQAKLDHEDASALGAIPPATP